MISRAVLAFTRPAVGDEPEGIAADPGRGLFFVANFADNAIAVLKASNGAVTSTVSVGTNPDAVAVNSHTGQVDVANFGDNTVQVLPAGG